MKREFHFYGLTTGISIQLILFQVVLFQIFYPSYGDKNDFFILLLFIFLMVTPLTSQLISYGNSGFKIAPTWIINTVVCLPTFISIIVFKIGF